MKLLLVSKSTNVEVKLRALPNYHSKLSNLSLMKNMTNGKAQGKKQKDQKKKCSKMEIKTRKTICNGKKRPIFLTKMILLNTVFKSQSFRVLMIFLVLIHLVTNQIIRICITLTVSQLHLQTNCKTRSRQSENIN